MIVHKNKNKTEKHTIFGVDGGNVRSNPFPTDLIFKIFENTW